MREPPADLPRWPDREHERALGGIVCGIDEVGYAPLAGPVVAAAVVLPPCVPPALTGLTDSKLLTRSQRERLFDVLVDIAAIGIGSASVVEIDRLNIYRANLLAMQRAVAALPIAPQAALVDGRAMPALGFPTQTLIKGDRRSLSIAAASVVAKVTRDRLMGELAAQHSGYGWLTNVGYGTDEHYLGLLRQGPTPHHRRSFAPVSQWFADRDSPTAGFRFRPVSVPVQLGKLTMFCLRRDLRAVFDGVGHHLGLVKKTRAGWVFQAVGYDDDGATALGAGPLAGHHGRQLAAPEREEVLHVVLGRR